MSKIICIIVTIAILCSIATGKIVQMSAAIFSGAKDAVSLLISIGGAICFWSGLMQVMDKSELSKKLSGLFRPFIIKVFGKIAYDQEAMQAISQNLAANMLGLGNAATPAGLRAAKRLKQLEGRGATPHSVYLLIAMNTASIQLLPTTIAAVRAEMGSAEPFDIMPAVWLSSVVAYAVAIALSKLYASLRARK